MNLVSLLTSLGRQLMLWLSQTVMNWKHLEHHTLSMELTFSFLVRVREIRNWVIYYGLPRRCRCSVMGLEVRETRCRACYQTPDTITHPLSACSIYVVSTYINRQYHSLKVFPTSCFRSDNQLYNIIYTDTNCVQMYKSIDELIW